jgi:hypothetical protein
MCLVEVAAWADSVRGAVYSTHELLLNHIRYILWDEVPSDLLRPKKTYDDFLVV